MKQVIEINLTFFNNEYKVRFWKSEYLNNNNLYIGVLAWNEKNECWDSWSDLTVNLPGKQCDSNKAFLDTNNCPHEIIAILMDKGYIKDTGITRQSGFCIYPLVEFSEDFLDGMHEE